MTGSAGSVLYVSVYDSTEKPEVFADEAAARRWAQDNRPSWKIHTELVRQRWHSRLVYDAAVQQARAAGWFQPGLVPTPEVSGALDSEYTSVTIVHDGLIVYVDVDKSDAEAILSVTNLSPDAPAGYTLHAVRVRQP